MREERARAEAAVVIMKSRERWPSAVVGGTKSPRGLSDLDPDEWREAFSFLLLCQDCHKPIDARDVAKRYSVKQLAQLKRDHEEGVRFLTDIGADKIATVIRVVGPIRGSMPELSYDTVLAATTAAGLLQQRLQGFSARYTTSICDGYRRPTVRMTYSSSLVHRL